MNREIEKDLIIWKGKKNKKPLVIQGARQIGKTYIIKKFGRENYDNVIYVNFEINLEIKSIINENINPEYIINKLELFFGEKILENKTLIVFDEIQCSERALTSLKYFCEDAPKIDIIAAGSLLGVAINREKYSFPVGKVQMINMYPLSFKEFLLALKQENLIEEITRCFNENTVMSKILHEKCLELYRSYLIVGGMPEVLKNYFEEKKLLAAKDIKDEILESYRKDMTKYATSSESNKILGAFNSIPVQLAKENKKFQYKIIQKGGTASIFGESILWLNNSGLINQVFKTNSNIPLEIHKDISSFKLYLNDVGLLISLGKYPLHQIDLKDEIGMMSIGSVTENYVANELRINNYDRYYWESDGIAEIDFLLQKDFDIIPIEVKSNTNIKSRSLNEYIKKYNPKYSIRISIRNFGFENNIKSVPLYAVFCI